MTTEFEHPSGRTRSALLTTPLAFLAGPVLAVIFLLLDNASFVHGELSRGQTYGRDFFNVWNAGQLARAEQFDTLYNHGQFNTHLQRALQEPAGISSFVYTPQLLLILRPLGALPYPAALLLWSLLGLGLLLWAALPYTKHYRVAALLVLAPTTALNLSFGQTGLITAALLIGGLRHLNARPILAGMLIGLLTFKPQLGLLLPIALLAGRHYRAFLAATLTTVLTVLASWLALGHEAWSAWLENQPWLFSTAFLESGTGAGIFMQISPFISVRQVTADVSLAWAVQWLCTCAAAIFVAWLFRQRTTTVHTGGDYASDNIYRFTALIAAGLIATPYAHNYDMAALTLAVAALLVYRGHNKACAALFSTLWIAPLMVLPFAMMGLPIMPVLLLVLIVVCTSLDRQAHSTRTVASAAH